MPTVLLCYLSIICHLQIIAENLNEDFKNRDFTFKNRKFYEVLIFFSLKISSHISICEAHTIGRQSPVFVSTWTSCSCQQTSCSWLMDNKTSVFNLQFPKKIFGALPQTPIHGGHSSKHHPFDMNYLFSVTFYALLRSIMQFIQFWQPDGLI